jgi:hypothetical protein
MIAAFVLIAIGGAIMGFRFRVSALVAASLLVLAFSVVSCIANGRGVLSAMAITLGLLATLQATYLLGLVFHSLVRARKDSHDPHYRNFTLTRSSGLTPTFGTRD